MKKKTIKRITSEFIEEIIKLHNIIEDEKNIINYLYDTYAIKDIPLSERKTFFKYIIETMESLWIWQIKQKK